MPSIRPAMAAASLATSDPSLLHAPYSGGSVAKLLSLPSGGHFLTFRPLPEARLRHRRLRSGGLRIVASASASGNNNGLDDLAARLMDAARSVSHRTGQVVESAWLRGVKFVESQDLEGKMKQSLSSANQKLEELSYDARKGAEKFDRRFRVSERAQEMADFASQQVKDADQQFGLVQKFRNASSDFQRNWPTYRRQLNLFLQTPIGQTLTTLVFLWFLLSGWLFRIILFSMWVLPLAAPLLIRSAARNMIVEGACPSCKRRFIGNRSQMVMCNYCKAVVWQPREDFSKDESDPSIIDVDID